jgi:hypothetical protein
VISTFALAWFRPSSTLRASAVQIPYLIEDARLAGAHERRQEEGETQ